MKKVRTLIVGAIAVSTLAIPAVAHAEGGGSCVGLSMQLTHTAVRSEAQAGNMRDLIDSFRTDPESWPWCGA